jgi:hypothetical protein
MNLVYFVRVNPTFDRKRIVFGYNQHDGFAGSYHAANGVGNKLVNEAGLGRANIGAPQLILTGDFFFALFRRFRTNLCKLLSSVAPDVGVYLKYFQLNLGRLVADLCEVRLQTPTLAFETRSVARH